MKAVNLVIMILVAFVAAAIVFFLTSARISSLETKVTLLEYKLNETEKRGPYAVRLNEPPVLKSYDTEGDLLVAPAPEKRREHIKEWTGKLAIKAGLSPAPETEVVQAFDWAWTELTAHRAATPRMLKEIEDKRDGMIRKALSAAQFEEFEKYRKKNPLVLTARHAMERGGFPTEKERKGRPSEED